MTHIALYNVVVGFTLKSELAVYCQSVTSARSVLTAARKNNFAGQINDFNRASRDGVFKRKFKYLMGFLSHTL